MRWDHGAGEGYDGCIGGRPPVGDRSCLPPLPNCGLSFFGATLVEDSVLVYMKYSPKTLVVFLWRSHVRLWCTITYDHWRAIFASACIACIASKAVTMATKERLARHRHSSNGIRRLTASSTLVKETTVLYNASCTHRISDWIERKWRVTSTNIWKMKTMSSRSKYSREGCRRSRLSQCLVLLQQSMSGTA